MKEKTKGQPRAFILPPSAFILAFQQSISKSSSKARRTREDACSTIRRIIRMKTFRPSSLLALPLALSLLLTTTTLTGSYAQRRRQPRQQPARKTFAGTALFVVSGEGDTSAPAEHSMDALALFDKGKFVDPVGDGDSSKEKPFAEKYFKAGNRYRLLFGGGDAGSVTVENYSEGCNTIHSKVNVAGPINSTESASKIKGRT